MCIYMLFISVSDHFSVFWQLKDLKQYFLNNFICFPNRTRSPNEVDSKFFYFKIIFVFCFYLPGGRVPCSVKICVALDFVLSFVL